MVDKMVVSPEVAHNLFNEHLIYLPYSYQVNSMPVEIAPVILEHVTNRNEIGNADNAFREYIKKEYEPTNDHIISLYNRIKLCTFNANKKMEPISFSVWMNIMRSKPLSILVLLEMTYDAKYQFIREVLLKLE
jgi:predicted O-linked N-acetylglucosamine transferase (SPINDLY family)